MDSISFIQYPGGKEICLLSPTSIKTLLFPRDVVYQKDISQTLISSYNHFLGPSHLPLSSIVLYFTSSIFTTTSFNSFNFKKFSCPPHYKSFLTFTMAANNNTNSCTIAYATSASTSGFAPSLVESDTKQTSPPHSAEYASQMRHQSWYPHFKSSESTASFDSELDASIIEDLAKERRHQSWYPHYKSSKSTANFDAEIDASKVEGLMKARRHQSWYPHYKIEC